MLQGQYAGALGGFGGVPSFAGNYFGANAYPYGGNFLGVNPAFGQFGFNPNYGYPNYGYLTIAFQTTWIKEPLVFQEILEDLILDSSRNKLSSDFL